MAYRRVNDPKEVVVFFKTSEREGIDQEAHEALDRRMHEVVSAMPGFLSVKSYEGDDGEKFSIVRFRSESALDAWRTNPDHRQAQERGRKEFYDYVWIQVCRVIREYEFRPDGVAAMGEPPTEKAFRATRNTGAKRGGTHAK